MGTQLFKTRIEYFPLGIKMYNKDKMNIKMYNKDKMNIKMYNKDKMNLVSLCFLLHNVL